MFRRMMACAFALACLSTPAMAQDKPPVTFAPDQSLSVTLKALDWSRVLGSIDELPARIANPLKAEIERQIMEQAEKKPVAVEKPPTPKK